MMRPYQLFNSTEAITFDGNRAVCFIIDLNSNVASVRVRNVTPGVKYTVILHQDATGGRTFAWPAQCVNAMPVCADPGATTVQNFIGMSGGVMEANLPGTWTGA